MTFKLKFENNLQIFQFYFSPVLGCRNVLLFGHLYITHTLLCLFTILCLMLDSESLQLNFLKINFTYQFSFPVYTAQMCYAVLMYGSTSYSSFCTKSILVGMSLSG